MASLFLFGAGASKGSGACIPFPPPLGSELFGELQKSSSLANKLSPEMVKLFENDFEQAMDKYYEDNPETISEFLRDMASYFVQFIPEPGNSYIDLIKLLTRNNKKVIFSSTNYDLLIEESAGFLGYLVHYQGLPVNDKHISLLKIHGSCNFLPDVDKYFGQFNVNLGDNPGAYILESNVKIASREEIYEFCKTTRTVGPALAMYAPSKRIFYCNEFINFQYNEWTRSVHSVKRIFVIGLRVHLIDIHIWHELSNTKADVYYVGFEPKEFIDWAKKNNKRNAYVLARTFAESILNITRILNIRNH